MPDPTDQPDTFEPPFGALQPPAEVLDHGAPRTGSPGRRRWPVVAGAAAVLTVGGAGVALGMALSGGGTQPEDVVPADALFYADVDFDPGAEQKVNVVRLLSKFPDVRDELGGESDIKTYLVEQLLAGSSDLAASEVTPWLGDRAGFAALWDEDAGAPAFVVAIQVTDEQQAEQTLSDSSGLSYGFDQGYLILTPPMNGTDGAETSGGLTPDDVIASAATTSLAEDPDFQQTMAPLGNGLASVYVDGPGLADVMSSEMGSMGLPNAGAMGFGSDAFGGQLGAVLRAEPAALEFVGRATMSGGYVRASTTDLLATLPDSTAFAFAVGGGGDQVATQWDQLSQQLDQLGQLPGFPGTQPAVFPPPKAEQDIQSRFDRAIARIEAQYNLRLPDDLITLFGDEMVLAVDGEGLLTAPAAGMRSLTDPADAADLASRLQPLIDDATAGYGITVRGVDDGLVVATSSEYADQLTKGVGGFLVDPQVTAALPDVEGASTVLWLDVDPFSVLAALADPKVGQNLDPLDALGITATTDDNGLSFRARLTFDD